MSEPFLLTLPVAGRRPRLHLHDQGETVSNFIRGHGVWQRPLTSFLLNYLKPDDVFVDVGANLGYFTVYAGLAVGAGGKVLAVEPDERNAALLLQNAELNGLSNVQLHRTAVADFIGEAPLFRGDFNAGAHSLIHKDDLNAEETSVPVTTLDRLLAQEPRVKLIKVDVQGAEVAVLRGLEGYLAAAEAKPGITLEFSPLELSRRDELDAIIDFIARHGYSLRAFIANERATTRPPQIRRATLQQIARDFIEVEDNAEFDILLLAPP
jgi:FkbM family methyltransferase